jgi:purine-binding chemotaxis protein CheW
MQDANQVVLFTLEGQHYGLRLSAVDKIVHMVEVTPLPKAPEIVLGVVNLQGRVIPVFDIRRRFRLPQREIQLSDHLIVAHTTRRAVALVVDSVTTVVDLSEQELVEPQEILPNLEYVEGVAKQEDGIILIHNLDEFLSLEEDRALDEAMLSG